MREKDKWLLFAVDGLQTISERERERKRDRQTDRQTERERVKTRRDGYKE
jgi:hypothetical protein